MSATSIEIDTRVINNVAFGPPTRRDFDRINTTLSFYALLPEGIRTLSTNSASIGSSPEGLLYVPSLDEDDPCTNASSRYIRQNVTRKADLPNLAFPPVAIAPWLSPQCVQSYLMAARRDIIRAFIFYLPDQGDMAPPSANDAAWSLSDGGRWKGDNPYPVYAVSSTVGQTVMDASAGYSGPNLTTAPNGDILAKYYDPNDFAKLYIDINLSVTAGLPSLWIFLVVILAVLVSIVGIVSVVMHFIQRRRRQQLRRRVANGEVDLELIGVKRLLVPQEILDKMPVHRYEKVDVAAHLSSDDEPKDVNASTDSMANKGPDADKKFFKGRGRKAAPTNHFEQPSCAICLDDFIPDETMVRQLPCGHIFHPECVDVFLTQNSSLCPLCKASALPAGYCPDVITNAMVRRERLLRRARQRAEQLGVGVDEVDQIVHLHTMDRFRLRRNNADVEMGMRPVQAPQPAAITDTSGQDNTATTSTSPTLDRRERARARVAAMLGPDAAPLNPEAEQARLPAWRRGLRRAFPTSR